MKARNAVEIVKRVTVVTLLFALVATLRAGTDQPQYQVEVVGTEFNLVLPDGRQVRGDDLVGMILTLEDPGSARRSIRIDAVQPDPKDPEITLYALFVLDPVSGTWENPCGPDAEGLAMGFPLSGTWTAAGEHIPSDHAFSITCTRGVNAKCVRMGYKPWKNSNDGTSLWGLHQACTRMLRADYCGDGTPHTRDGTLVDIYDTVGIQSPQPESGLSFEAAWRADGAVCVRKVRIPEITTLEALVQSCPARLRNYVGPECTEERALQLGALAMNES
jgi:ADYC domain-containing protein